jgi:DNA-binding MarR family transcriptional regulator
MAEQEGLIADIMDAQRRLQHLFAYDRSDPLFTSHLTLSQLKILMLLSVRDGTSGRELAALMGVGLATLSGMIDRLVAHDLVARREDTRDRRVRRITLTPAGADLIGTIITAGAEKQRRLLDRLDTPQLRVVEEAMSLLVRAASEEFSAADELGTDKATATCGAWHPKNSTTGSASTSGQA